MSDRHGVEIDYCPQCRGVWLDRGELDKIIERSDNDPQQPDRSYDQDRRQDDRPRSDYNNHKKKNRESFLGDLFDF